MIHPYELSKPEGKFVKHVLAEKLTMVSSNSLMATAFGLKYVISRKIVGDFVECGTWRGGNGIVAARFFALYNENRQIHLFDTFTGMTEPSELDWKLSNRQPAKQKFLENQQDTHNDWCYASLEDVQKNFEKMDVMSPSVKFIKGDVMETLRKPENIPEKISVLRLDTDWYESTKLELEVLYPKLSNGGIIIVDDYGWWAGSRQATDEYFEHYGNRPFFLPLRDGGRIGVKHEV